MQVRGIGQLKLQVEVQTANGDRQYCTIGVFTPSDAPDSLSPFQGHTTVKMTLHPRQGMNPDRLSHILKEASFDPQRDDYLDPCFEASGVCLNRFDDGHDGQKTLLVQCRGVVEDAEGLMRSVAKIIKRAMRIIAAKGAIPITDLRVCPCCGGVSGPAGEPPRFGYDCPVCGGGFCIFCWEKEEDLSANCPHCKSRLALT